jgi:sugar-specific transcriptional regulator TrmB
MANSAEKLQSISDTLTEIKQNIQNKYDRMLKKIEEYENELIELDSKYNFNSPQFRENKRREIESKINKYREILENWVNTQLNAAQEWFESATEPIKANIEKAAMAMINSILKK